MAAERDQRGAARLVSRLREQARKLDRDGKTEKAIQVDAKASIKSWEIATGRSCPDEIKEKFLEESRDFFSSQISQKVDQVNSKRHDARQNPKATNPRRKADFVEVAIRILETGVKSIGLVVFVIERLTGRWSCFPIGAVAGYMTLLNIEGYYNALGRSDSFLPKPYISDGASLANLATAVNNSQFWLATVIGICSSAVAAKWWRDRQTIAEAKAKYAEVKNERTGDLPDDAIDLARYRRKKLKRAGMKRVRLLGLLFLICLGTDVATAIVNYPLSGKNFLVHFIWALLSVFGSEIFLAAFQDSWEELRKDPKVEVVR